MTGAVVVLAGLIGLIVGSFLTVVTARVPDGLSIVTPRSRCPSCSTPIATVDNLPLVSYLLRRGRCRSCDVRIPVRYPATELVSAVLFALVAWRIGEFALVPAYCVLAGGLIALTVIDLERFRLPTPIIVFTAILGLPLLVVAAVVHHNTGELIRVPVTGGVALAIFGIVFLVAPRGMGLGDVRLAALCGGFLGYLGYRIAAVGFLAAFVAAGGIGVVLLATGRASRKSKIPFGPFLAFGAMLAVLYGPPIAHFWLR